MVYHEQARVFQGRVEWWRRRESNPRPKIFHMGLYILILKFEIRLFGSPSGGIAENASPFYFASAATGISATASLLVDALTGTAGPFRQDGSRLKRLQRSYNRLRLYLISRLF